MQSKFFPWRSGRGNEAVGCNSPHLQPRYLGCYIGLTLKKQFKPQITQRGAAATEGTKRLLPTEHTEYTETNFLPCPPCVPWAKSLCGLETPGSTCTQDNSMFKDSGRIDSDKNHFGKTFAHLAGEAAMRPRNFASSGIRGHLCYL